ncbi:hypothetical protein FJZ28_01230 [Candidatus Peregrinibacteria bacterium]|nr:hypothetical protein [Candidatus Peregrinibacteria bacterium]
MDSRHDKTTTNASEASSDRDPHVSEFDADLSGEAERLRFDIAALLAKGETGAGLFAEFCASRSICTSEGENLTDAAIRTFLGIAKYRTRNKFRSALTKAIGKIHRKNI